MTIVETSLAVSEDFYRPIEHTPEGRLRYKLYGQDGRFIEMTCQDTPDMQRFVRWTRRFDRYTKTEEEALVAQRIEYRIPNPKVAGSSPAERTKLEGAK